MNKWNVPKKKGEKKEAAIESRIILDAYESWLKRQPIKSVKANPGFISAEETEVSS
jgi:hypothetical protein